VGGLCGLAYFWQVNSLALVVNVEEKAKIMDQTPFNISKDDLTTNPEHRCPSVLILDVSGSMQGDPIKQLQEGVAVYRDSLYGDSLARKRVEVAILTFGGVVEVVQSFTTAENFTAPALTARGDTPMGEAVVTALKLLTDRKTEYKSAAIQYYRPWVFLLTDGGPTDANSRHWTEAKDLIKEGEAGKKFSFFTVGVDGADLERLTELNPARTPLKLQGLEFKKMFQWLSSSQQSVSRSNPGDKVQLTNPTAGPAGWAEV
jgi:uncharacterized protein YegL